MKIVATSDLHGFLPGIRGHCDLLLVVGDICPDFQGSGQGHGRYGDLAGGAVQQATWLRTTFADWLQAIDATHIIGIAGNHDFIFEQRYLVPDLPWIYLQDSWVDIEGFKVYGSPWVPNLRNWAFYATEAELQARWDAIPADIDILMTHGPPNGFGDKVLWGNHVGSPSLSSQSLYRIQPRLHVFGHIHEGHGRWDDEHTALANVSHVNERYTPIHPPMEFDL